MAIHHVVTIMLTVCSYSSGFFRIGSVIMLLHDLADIFLEVSLHAEKGGRGILLKTIFSLFLAFQPKTY